MTRNIQTEVKHPNPFRDFAGGYNNGVSALYVIGRDLLEAEGRRDLIGVPFLIWGKGFKTDEKATYLNQSDWIEFVENKLVIKGGVPDVVNVNGIEYPIDRLAGTYVPYSFGVGHQADERENFQVRTSEEYCDFVNRVVPRVLEIREARKRSMEKNIQDSHKFLAKLRGYKPLEFPRDRPY